MRRYLFLLAFAFLFLLYGCLAQKQEQPQPPQQPAITPSAPKPTALEPSQDQCIYDAKLKELLCGRQFMALKQGRVTNITGRTKLDFCGLAGLYDTDTNETYLIYIFENNDQNITLNNETSKKAMGYFAAFGSECK